MGAILSQEGGTTLEHKNQPNTQLHTTCPPSLQQKKNYDIYERELLAVLKSLKHWCPHLTAMEKPVTVLTDHANLTFWKNARKVNRRVAR